MTGTVSFSHSDEPEEEREPTLLVNKLERLAERLLSATRLLSLRLAAGRITRVELEALRELLAATPGSCPVEIVLELGDGVSAVLVLEALRVALTDGLLGDLERLFGASVAELG